MRTMEGHTKAVRPIRCSPCGKYVFSACRQGVVKKWSSYNGKLLQDLKVHKSDLYGLTVANDGLHIWSAGDDRIMVKWNTKTGEKVMEIKTDHRSWIEGMVVTQDDRYIFSGSGDKTVKMWEVPSEIFLKKYKN